MSRHYDYNDAEGTVAAAWALGSISGTVIYHLAEGDTAWHPNGTDVKGPGSISYLFSRQHSHDLPGDMYAVDHEHWRSVRVAFTPPADQQPLDLTNIKTIDSPFRLEVGCPIAECTDKITVNVSNSELINRSNLNDSRIYYPDLLNLCNHLESWHGIKHSTKIAQIPHLHTWSCDIDLYQQRRNAVQACADIRASIARCLQSISFQLGDIDRCADELRREENDWWDLSTYELMDLRSHIAAAHRHIRDLERINARLVPDWQDTTEEQKS